MADETWPWIVDIDMAMAPFSNVNWDTPSTNGSHRFNMSSGSSGTQNDERVQKPLLGAGTWTLEIMHDKFNNRGIYTIYLDGVSQGTIDGYNASSVPNTLSSITGIVVATGGVKELKIKMESKNASSSAYYSDIQAMRFKRTA